MSKQKTQTEKYGNPHRAFPFEIAKTNFLIDMEVKIW